MRRFFALTAVLAAPLALAGPIVTDGELSDWSDRAPVHSDPAGDHTGVFDLTDVWIASDSERIHFQIDVGTDAFNLQSGPYPVAQGLEFILRFEGSPTEMLTVVTQTHVVRQRISGSSTNTTASDIGLVILPTFASERYEFSVPRSFAPGATSVRLETENTDLLITPYVALEDAAPAPTTATTDRPASTTFRLASINTLNDFGGDTTGLEHPTRGPQHARLISAARADIYCFQEEYSTSAGDIETLLEALDPLADDAEWNAIKSGDTVVASHYPLLLPGLFDRTRFGDAVAFVDMTSIGRGLVLVASIHPACCGHAGNSNDNSRVTQHANIAEALTQIASGTSEGAAPGSSTAPAIIAGDWNLVGSRTPLTILENAGLTAPPIADLADPGVAVTWRERNPSIGDFFPGRLDLIAHHAAGLARLNAFALNTATMPAGDLASLGLLAGDSRASDHLMLVADFRLTIQADLDGDGVVGSLDLAFLLAAWGQGGPADLTGDGIVGSADLAAILAAWGP